MASETTEAYPFRPPKKFPAKDLHGRVRMAYLNYRDFDRFKTFYTNVFGWDMFELPQTAGGTEAGDAHPSLLIATGPSYETWEGFIPGHMNAMAHYDPTGEAKPVCFMEVHMDRPLSVTIAEIESLGGTVIGDRPGDDQDDWLNTVTVADPAGNLLNLWKCPSSRTWDEPEADYDKD